MSRMSDRELWVSVFNTALTAAMAHGRQTMFHRNPKLLWNGEEVGPSVFARMVANKALQDAPKDEA